MTTYTAYFRTEHQWGTKEFDADTPEQALAIARQFATENYDQIDLFYYDPCPNAVAENYSFKAFRRGLRCAYCICNRLYRWFLFRRS